jgi:dolichyl-phosphate-mannose--protein O-mannosyl transferase
MASPSSWYRKLIVFMTNLVIILILHCKNFWVKENRQIYLIGNPFVWYLSTIAVALYLYPSGD